MAEDSAAKAESGSTSAGGGKKPLVLYALVVVNMLVVLAVGAMVFKAHKSQVEGDRVAPLIQGEKQQQAEDKAKAAEITSQSIPMETFLVNLAGTRGNKLLKVNLELEVDSAKVMGEIDKRRPQIRDLIIIHLSSKTLEQISERDGKNQLRNELRDTLNSFLTEGRIKQVLFTEFLYQ